MVNVENKLQLLLNCNLIIMNQNIRITNPSKNCSVFRIIKIFIIEEDYNSTAITRNDTFSNERIYKSHSTLSNAFTASVFNQAL